MNYIRLAIMTTISCIAMYILMYMMVDSFANVYPNINQFYMAGLMTMPMVLIELIVMGTMYPNKKLNLFLVGFSTAFLIMFIIFIRKQTGVGDQEFLKSMIPHHGAAILMCEQTQIQDPEIEALCKNIVSTQQSEINFMKAKLNTMTHK